MLHHGTFGKTFMTCSVSSDDTCQAEVGEKRNFSALWRLSGRCRTGGPGSPQRMSETEKSGRGNYGETSDKQILTVIILMLLDDDEFRRETNYAFSDNLLFFCKRTDEFHLTFSSICLESTREMVESMEGERRTHPDLTRQRNASDDADRVVESTTTKNQSKIT